MSICNFKFFSGVILPEERDRKVLKGRRRVGMMSGKGTEGNGMIGRKVTVGSKRKRIMYSPLKHPGQTPPMGREKDGKN
jgi:hypothetical protein